jgi:prolyl 4-hydroxylase
MHVDTVSTHVVSAIINVDQGEIEKDWPLLILDHHDNEHSVIMKPGDMLLYESAKLLHGRPGSCLFYFCVSFSQ